MNSKLIAKNTLFPDFEKQKPNKIIIKYSVKTHQTTIFFDEKLFWSGTEISISAKSASCCGLTFCDYSCYEEICNFFKQHVSFSTISNGLCSSEFSKRI